MASYASGILSQAIQYQSPNRRLRGLLIDGHDAYHSAAQVQSVALVKGFVMKVVFAVIALIGSVAVSAASLDRAGNLEHGGGCRKDSPPGQCCHMDRKSGVSHCH